MALSRKKILEEIKACDKVLGELNKVLDGIESNRIVREAFKRELDKLPKE